VDVAVVVPAGIPEQLASGHHAQLQIYHDIVDPTQRDWLNFNTYVLVNELNHRVLTDTIRNSLKPVGVPAVPPDVVVQPLQSDVVSLASANPSYVAFYTPGVLALLLQHLGVTLGALSLVRERLLGSVELFRVAPVSTLEILVGKSLAYGLVLLALGAVLTLAGHYLLGVPFLGSLEWLAATFVLLIVASLGIGFAISALSQTEHQAVQLAMLTLLTSVFFSGFFVPLSTFYPAALVLADVLPVTHGVDALQALMLRNQLPHELALFALGALAVSSFVYATIRFHRQLRLD
jgi:ABC-2 type transport system permease protein